jgi:multiple sugar transport system substrate-binding protein
MEIGGILVKFLLCVVSILISLTLFVADNVSSAGKIKVLSLYPKEIFEKMTSEFRKNHKNATITYLKSSSYGTFNPEEVVEKPDIYIGSPLTLGANISLGFFTDLKKILPKSIFNDILSTYIDAYLINGHLLGLPISANLQELRYNATRFKNFGLETPNENWSWDKEFYNSCLKLTKDTDGDGNIDQWGVVGLPSWINYSSVIYCYGGEIVDKNYKKVMYTKKPAIDAIDFVVRLHKDGLAEMFDYSKPIKTTPYYLGTPFYNSSSAMTFNQGIGNKLITSYSQVNFKIEASPIPKGPKGAVPILDTLCLGIFENSTNKSGAIELVKQLLSTTGQLSISQLTQQLPVTQSAIANNQWKKSMYSPFLKSYQLGKARSIRTEDFNYIEEGLWRNVLSFIKGEVTRQEFIDKAERAGQLFTQSQYYLYE